MAKKIYRRNTVFPSSDPDVLLKKLIPPRETYVRDETIPRKEKPTAYISTFRDRLKNR
jgi:hypothetical protein